MKKKLKGSRKTPKPDPLQDDLSSFIEDGGWESVQFELREKKNKVVSLRLSEKLFEEIEKQAKAMGLNTQKYIRLSLEKIVRKRSG